MGNNAAFTTFEGITVGAYDLGKLDRELLEVIMQANAGCDIDWGGCADLKAKDGLDITDIVIKVYHGEEALTAPPDLPDDPDDWTEAERDRNDEWQEKRQELFQEVEEKFGWC